MNTVTRPIYSDNSQIYDLYSKYTPSYVCAAQLFRQEIVLECPALLYYII